MSYMIEITEIELDWDTDEVDTAEIQTIVTDLEWQDVFKPSIDLFCNHSGKMDIMDGVFNNNSDRNFDILMKALAKAGVYGIITLSGEEPYDFERYELDGREAVHKIGHVIWEDE